MPTPTKVRLNAIKHLKKETESNNSLDNIVKRLSSYNFKCPGNIERADSTAFCLLISTSLLLFPTISLLLLLLLLLLLQHEVFASRGDSEKKSEFQMGFEPTTLRDLVGGSWVRIPSGTRIFFPSLLLMQKLHVVFL